MKLKFIILKYRLFNFLSRFIPYFKKIRMSKEEVLKYFDLEMKRHFNRLQNHQSFKLLNGQFCQSIEDDSFYTIKYVLTYKNIDFSIDFNFSMNFDFYSDKIKRRFNVPEYNGDPDVYVEIFDLLKHFRNMRDEHFLSVLKYLKFENI